MSLKARIEAVVYAADEPVTIAQLASLFAEEALSLKQEQAAAAAAAQPAPTPLSEESAAVPALDGELPLEARADAPAEAPSDHADAMNGGEMLPEGPEDDAVLDPWAASSADPNAEIMDSLSPSGAATSALPAEAPAAEVPTAEAPIPADPEAEARRAARQRDRDIRDTLRAQLDELIEEYARGDRGIEIREIAGGYRFGTKPECHDAVRGFVKSLKPPMKLSLQALETLAVIAYKQPVTSPEVSEIRGVDSSGVLGSLISRKLITTAGRKQVIGRPILYKTTKEFLLRFGLKDVNELPSIEEFEKMAGELAETDEEVEAQGAFGGDRELPFADTVESDDAPLEAPHEDLAQPAQEQNEHAAHTELAVTPAPLPVAGMEADSAPAHDNGLELAHQSAHEPAHEDAQHTVAKEDA